MADNKEPEDEQGKVLPIREMMSLISADPADGMYSTLVPTDAPATGSGPVVQPPRGDELHVDDPSKAS